MASEKIKNMNAISTGTLSISSDYSSQLSGLYSSVTRCGDVVTVYATFTITSDISQGAAKEMFSGLIAANRLNNQWIMAYAPTLNKVVRLQIRGDGIYQNWTDLPAAQYHIIPFSYIAS